VITLVKLQPQTLNWTISEPDPSNPGSFLPVNDCTGVVATLYAGRSLTNPDLIPGTPVSELEDLELIFVADGVYAGEVGADFNPVASSNYVVVIDADRPEGSPPSGAFPYGHWEEPATVIVNS
jgi:hypothetical protein